MQLGINPVGSPDATIEVFEDQGLIVRIVLNLSLDLVGLLPFPLITNQPQQPACQRIRWIERDSPRQMLQSLGREAV